MDLTFQITGRFLIDHRNLGFPGLDMGPIGKRKVIENCPFTKRTIVHVGGYYKSDGYGMGRRYHRPTLYFVQGRVLVASCVYSNSDKKAVNRLSRGFIESGVIGLRCTNKLK